MSEWRPIETAPKDGREVLVYVTLWTIETNQLTGDLTVNRVRPNGGYIAMEHSPGDGLNSSSASVTHWMPLPDPPRQEQR